MRPIAQICSLAILSASLIFLATCSSRQVSYREANMQPVSPNALNINIASVDELEMLPYIGRKTAESIVEFRNENGPFRRPENLLQIRGISEKRYSEIRHHITTE